MTCVFARLDELEPKKKVIIVARSVPRKKPKTVSANRTFVSGMVQKVTRKIYRKVTKVVIEAYIYINRLTNLSSCWREVMFMSLALFLSSAAIFERSTSC